MLHAQSIEKLGGLGDEAIGFLRFWYLPSTSIVFGPRVLFLRGSKYYVTGPYAPLPITITGWWTLDWIYDWTIWTGFRTEKVLNDDLFRRYLAKRRKLWSRLAVDTKYNCGCFIHSVSWIRRQLHCCFADSAVWGSNTVRIINLWHWAEIHSQASPRLNHKFMTVIHYQ